MQTQILLSLIIFSANYHQKHCGNGIYKAMNFQNKGQEEKNQWGNDLVTEQNRNSKGR